MALEARLQEAALRASRSNTIRIDFSAGADANRTTRQYTISERLVSGLMTEAVKQTLAEVTGVHEVRFDIKKRKVTVVGSPVQVEKAGILLQRASTHCHWGVSDAKIHAILCPRTGCTTTR